MGRFSNLALLTVFALLLAACGSSPDSIMREREIFGGSDEWIQALTADIHITTLSPPDGTTPVNAPLDYVIRLENTGRRTPHLDTLYVPIDGDFAAADCRVLSPAVSHTDAEGDSYLFTFPHTPVKSGQMVEIRLQCAFSRPGHYELMVSAQFAESTHTFAGIVSSLEVR